MATAAVNNIEVHRLEEQVRLDGLKTAAERNKMGQFATPPALALSLARYLQDLRGEGPIRFLDPAVGSGSFYAAVSQTFAPEHIAAATGVELDPRFSDIAMRLWGDRGLRVVQGDFTRQPLPNERFDLILANPPYVRHHHLPGAEKERLKARLALSLHLDMSGLAGLYCYFMLLCHDWMEDQGLALWLVPSEFMDVNYGTTLRRYLTERVTLLHIHRFCPTDAQFTEALVSSAVVVFRKSPPPSDHCVRFSFAGSIESPQTEGLVVLDMLRRSGKWTQFPSTTSLHESGEPALGDIFAIKRGLATGSNDFFILKENDIETWKIPRQMLKPILPGPRHLQHDIVEALPGGMPDVSPQLFLFDSSEKEEQIRIAWPRLYEYLEMGRKRKIHAAYLASRRAPWYSQERRPPAPFLCTYMGRSRDGKHPFRFIWNRSQATAHNVYLMLYPKGPLRDAFEQSAETEARVFKALQQIAPAQFLSQGRVYGGGLHKVEPKELAKIPARLVLDAIGVPLNLQRQNRLF
jgi:predicted RNA methylase